ELNKPLPIDNVKFALGKETWSRILSSRKDECYGKYVQRRVLLEGSPCIENGANKEADVRAKDRKIFNQSAISQARIQALSDCAVPGFNSFIHRSFGLLYYRTKTGSSRFFVERIHDFGRNGSGGSRG